ncbi:MAG TPA: flagellar hook-associated protein FlgK [Polyangiaceae bacterium]|nr:flagellar hook-associated protein FlgK [Polyangiaceae bacterium]
MAGLTSLLNTARDALTTQSYALNVTGQNVANANTPLYVRREAVIQTRALGTQTTGSVEAQGLRRATDAYADRRFFEANSGNSAASQYDSELERIEALFNDLDGTGIGTSLDAVYQSFQQLSAQPTNSATRAAVLDKLDVFATQTRQVGDQLAEQRLEMLTRGRESAEQANQRAQEIAKLNDRIVRARQSGEDASDLIDELNNKILGLSEIIDVRTLEAGDGSILVQSAGMTLIEGAHARTLSVGLDGDGQLQILASRGGTAAIDITSGVSGGKLAGIKEARDEDLFEVAKKFDEFVFDVATAINTQHRSGVGLDGSTTLDVFDVGTTSEGAARTLRVSRQILGNPDALAASDSLSNLPGGSGNAVLLGRLAETTNIFGKRTPAQAYGDLVGLVGTKRAGAHSDLELRQDIFAQVRTTREALSGVSLDEEMVNLQRYQRAYEAAGKVISTVDALLEELIARVGR